MDKEVKKQIEELKEMGLSQPGFKAPENYFEGFTDTLFSKITEESLPKETGFQTPVTYFNHLEDSILTGIQQKAYKRKTNLRILYTITSVAALLLIYMGITEYSTSNNLTFDSITVTDVQAYIEAGNMIVDTYTLASIDTPLNLSSLLQDAISDEEINDYLNTVEPEFLFIPN